VKPTSMEAEPIMPPPAADSLVQVPCPLCAARGGLLPVNVPGRDLHIRKYGPLYAGHNASRWAVCGICGFVHQNPRPSVEALNSFYLSSQYHDPASADWEAGGVERYLEFSEWYYRQKAEWAIAATGLKTGTVFDIGCGYGGALKVFERLGWRCTGVESDKRLHAFATGELGLTRVRNDILRPDLRLDKQVDLVFSNHAFEHFADLPGVMAGIRGILKPGGVVCTIVPTYYCNRSGTSRRWMNSSHYSLFTHRSLNRLFAGHGLSEIQHTYRGWRREIDDLWHLARLDEAPVAAQAQREDPRQVQRYLNVINPLRTIAWSPFYSFYQQRVTAASAAKLLLTSPGRFVAKVRRRIAGGSGGRPA